MTRLTLHLAALAGLAFALAAPPAGGARADEELRESGTVEVSQVQVALFWSGSLGGGTLHFEGKSYDFTIGGLGYGGIGGSSIEATGKVYNLDSVEQFPGAYGQARLGFAAGTESSGKLWLQNADGVYIELDAKRQGLMLSGGGDAVYIDFD